MEEDKRLAEIEKIYMELSELYLEEANASVHTYEDGMEFIQIKYT
jgi:hypothetical protein